MVNIRGTNKVIKKAMRGFSGSPLWEPPGDPVFRKTAQQRLADDKRRLAIMEGRSPFPKRGPAVNKLGKIGSRPKPTKLELM